MDPFHRLDNLKNQFVSVAFCMNSVACNVQHGAMIELPGVDSTGGFPRHYWMEVNCLELCYP